MASLALDAGEFGVPRHCSFTMTPMVLISACAGKSMALDTVWIAVASILSVYKISKAVDDRGNIITPEVKLKPGTVWFVTLSPFAA